MSITDKTIVSKDVSAAGHVIFNTQLNAAAGFSTNSIYPKIVILEGLCGYNEYGPAVSYDLAGYNAMVEVMCSTTGSQLSYYKMYNYISSNGEDTSGIIDQQTGTSNSASILLAIGITNVTVLNVQFQQQAINDGATFMVKITAWGRA